MSNVRLLGESHADGVTLTATSEAITVDNIQDTDVQEVWRSTDTADQTVSGTFVGTQNVNVIHLTNINAGSGNPFILQLSDDGFSTVKYAESFGKWAKDMSYAEATLWLSGVSGGDRVLDANGDAVLDANGDAVLDNSYSLSLPITATDMRLIIGDTDNSDGYIEIGRMKIGEYFDAPNSNNVKVGPEFGYEERSSLVTTRSGGFRSENLTPRRRISVEWEFAKDDDNWSIGSNSFTELFEHVGQRVDVLMSVYPEENTDRERRHTILGRMTDISGPKGNFTVIESGIVKLMSTISITVTEAL